LIKKEVLPTLSYRKYSSSFLYLVFVSLYITHFCFLSSM